PGRADIELVAREDGGVAGVSHAPGLAVQRGAGAGALAEVVALPGPPVLLTGAGIGPGGAAVIGGGALEGLFGEAAGFLLAAEERPRPVDVPIGGCGIGLELILEAPAAAILVGPVDIGGREVVVIDGVDGDSLPDVAQVRGALERS